MRWVKTTLFFSREKFRPHSLTRCWEILYFFPRRLYFIFRNEFFDFGHFIFFARKSLKSINSNSTAGKKNTLPEKKYSIFTHSFEFSLKVAKVEFFREIKKYDEQLITALSILITHVFFVFKPYKKVRPFWERWLIF